MYKIIISIPTNINLFLFVWVGDETRKLDHPRYMGCSRCSWRWTKMRRLCLGCGWGCACGWGCQRLHLRVQAWSWSRGDGSCQSCQHQYQPDQGWRNSGGDGYQWCQYPDRRHQTIPYQTIPYQTEAGVWTSVRMLNGRRAAVATLSSTGLELHLQLHDHHDYYKEHRTGCYLHII